MIEIMRTDVTKSDRAEPSPVTNSLLLQDIAPVLVGSIPVHPVTLAQTLAFFVAAIESGRKTLVMYANAHAVTLASRDQRLATCFRRADLVFCDGKSVQWAARWLDSPLPARFTPPDWIDRLCELCAARSWRLFLLGGRPGIAEAAARILRDRHEGLEVGSHHGYFHKDGQDNQRVVAGINEFGPQVLLVGFGMPLQEYWLDENLSHLNTNVAMSIGAMLDFVAGRVRRGPAWLTDSGFEWLTRLVREPRRLGTRYLLGNPRFVWLVLAQKWHDLTTSRNASRHEGAESS